MEVPRKLVEAMLNQSPKGKWGLPQIVTYLKLQGESGRAGILQEYVDQLELISQEEDSNE